MAAPALLAGGGHPAESWWAKAGMQPCGCVLYARMHKDLVFKALTDPTRRLMPDELSERKEQTLYTMKREGGRLCALHSPASS